MAHSVHRERTVLLSRMVAASRIARDCGRPKGKRDSTTIYILHLRGLEAHVADLRHRCHDERRVLSDVHIHGGAPQRSHERWLRLPAGEHTEPDFCAPCQALWWLAIGSSRPTKTHDHPDGRDDSFNLSSVPAHAVRHTLRIRPGAGLTCRTTRNGAGTPRRHV